jgi:hypothetical protein
MPIGLTWATASDSVGKRKGGPLGRSAFGQRCLVGMCEDRGRDVSERLREPRGVATAPIGPDSPHDPFTSVAAVANLLISPSVAPIGCRKRALL